MKKLILSVVAMATMVFAANAVTYMRVKTADGQVVKYDVEKVTEVDFEEESSTPSDPGLTVSGTVGNYTYVDLGLSVKWATYNVGATKPTEYGDYFAWGETMPKENYSDNTYKWCTVDADGNLDKFTKYNIESDYGTVDNKTVLESEDDAATANWGSAWRMPTFDEIKELLDSCDWKLVADFKGSGVNGQLGTSKVNGNTVFLPAAGCRYGSELKRAGDIGSYWSSSLIDYGSIGAYSLVFLDVDVNWGNGSRDYGRSVRAVAK